MYISAREGPSELFKKRRKKITMYVPHIERPRRNDDKTCNITFFLIMILLKKRKYGIRFVNVVCVIEKVVPMNAERRLVGVFYSSIVGFRTVEGVGK